MSFHSDYESWLRMTDPVNCPVCRNEPMPDGMVDLYELPHSCLNAEPVDCLRGACQVTAKKHFVELFELDEAELLGFMKEVQCYALALKEVTGAVKINYEVHGNTTPHLHLHLYPRYRDDPFPGKAIDYSQKRAQYGPGEYEAFLQRMRAQIDASLQCFGLQKEHEA